MFLVACWWNVCYFGQVWCHLAWLSCTVSVQCSCVSVLHFHIVLDVSYDALGPEDDEETRPYVPIPALHLPHQITTVSFVCISRILRTVCFIISCHARNWYFWAIVWTVLVVKWSLCRFWWLGAPLRRYYFTDISAFSKIKMYCIILRYINFLFSSTLFCSIVTYGLAAGRR